MQELLILSSSDLKQLLTMPDCIDAAEQAFIAVSRNEVSMPLRTNINMPMDNAVSLYMPAYHAQAGLASIKSVMLNYDNPDKGQPLIHGLITAFDSKTGHPLALIDGEIITTMRTGAGAGFATKLLANDDAKTMAIFGVGPNAETQVEAVCAVRDIRKLIIFNRTPAKAVTFATTMQAKFALETEIAQSPSALQEADIICTATSSDTPVFDDSNVKTGAHINGVGSFRPTAAELPSETIKRAYVYADQRNACLSEAGDLTQRIDTGIISANHIIGEIGELAQGKIKGRQAPTDITFFKSVGLAAQDLFTVKLAIDKATELGIGQKVYL